MIGTFGEASNLHDCGSFSDEVQMKPEQRGLCMQRRLQVCRQKCPLYITPAVVELACQLTEACATSNPHGGQHDGLWSVRARCCRGCGTAAGSQHKGASLSNSIYARCLLVPLQTATQALQGNDSAFKPRRLLISKSVVPTRIRARLEEAEPG